VLTSCGDFRKAATGDEPGAVWGVLMKSFGLHQSFPLLSHRMESASSFLEFRMQGLAPKNHRNSVVRPDHGAPRNCSKVHASHAFVRVFLTVY
jgi:hypothetical protein